MSNSNSDDLPSSARGRLGAAWKRFVTGGLLLFAGLMVVLDPAHSPIIILMLLAGTERRLRYAWSAARGTALRGALFWTTLAIGLGLAAQALAISEPLESGRPLTGRLTYVMVLAMLAGLISVLGARNPGGGAWAILMVLLVIVFLIPWLEGTGRLRRAQGVAQLPFESPWTLFYGLLVLAGVTNFLPTRYGPAALCVGAGLVLEFLALTRIGWPAEARAMAWSGVAWTLAASVYVAGWLADQPARGWSNLDRIWLWFRDHWGVVWALRTQDRFNRTAELAGWPFRLTWFGLAPTDSAAGNAPITPPKEAEKAFRGLIRRFVDANRLDHLSRAR
jgi:hypothetical protein